jgi:putative ABC transport system permease protein
MGAVAVAIGILLASALTAGVLHWVFDLNWRLHPDVLAVGLVLTILLALTVGFFGTFRILGEKPLAILRHE